jgi:hypothetical protein
MNKQEKRAQKLAAAQARQPDLSIGPINCACLIHGNAYSWDYVERLYNMLSRHLTSEIRFHVYTEADRPVPAPMIRHDLVDWGISGPKRSWWYKLQLFNSMYHAGPLLYFDLDTVIINNIDWITHLPLRYFWTVRDFKYLWRPTHQGINSSIMWWDTRSFDFVWKNFRSKNLDYIMKQHPGDQDYITKEIDPNKTRFMNTKNVSSWRWQCLDGGYDFKQRIYMAPNTGVTIPTDTSVLIFHGKPKPADLQDQVIINHWR